MRVILEYLEALERTAPTSPTEEALIALARVLVRKIETLQRRIERLEQETR